MSWPPGAGYAPCHTGGRRYDGHQMVDLPTDRRAALNVGITRCRPALTAHATTPMKPMIRTNEHCRSGQLDNGTPLALCAGMGEVDGAICTLRGSVGRDMPMSQWAWTMNMTACTARARRSARDAGKARSTSRRARPRDGEVGSGVPSASTWRSADRHAANNQTPATSAATTRAATTTTVGAARRPVRPPITTTSTDARRHRAGAVRGRPRGERGRIEEPRHG